MLASMLGYFKSRMLQFFRTSAHELKSIITSWLAPYEIYTTFLVLKALMSLILLKDAFIDCSLQNTQSSSGSSYPLKNKESVTET